MPRHLLLSAVCSGVMLLASPALPAFAQGGAAGPDAPSSTSQAQPSRRAPKAGKPKPAAQEPGAGRAPRDSSAHELNTPAYRELVEQALSEFKLQNWAEARLLFRRAHELNPNARTLRGIGVVSYEMREHAQAVVALTAALADGRQPLTPAQRKECEELLARARTFVAVYTLTLDPPDLTLTVDDASPVRDDAGRLYVGFGEHTLRATAEGYEGLTLPLSVQGGESDSLPIVLRRPAPQVAVQLPSVQDPGAPQAVAPVVGARAAPSERVREGGLRYTWVALGASAGLGGAAVGTWLAGERKFDSLRDTCQAAAEQGSPCVRGETDTGSAKRFERATNALLGLSAASLVTAVVLLPLEWPRERRVALDVGPSRVAVRGSF